MIDRVYLDITIANNTKINHIMVTSADDNNAISIDRILSKTKIGKGSWYFNNSLLCKFEFSSANFFIIKKNPTFQQVTGWNTPNLVLKKILRYFPKI